MWRWAGEIQAPEAESGAGLPRIAYSKSAGSQSSGLQAPGPETGQPAGAWGAPRCPQALVNWKERFRRNGRQGKINETNNKQGNSLMTPGFPHSLK